MIDLIKHRIEDVLTDSLVIVSDPQDDGEHFQAIVVSADFENMSLVKQHQKVMNALKEEFKEKVHALALKTFTPAKWEEDKTKYI